MNAMEIAARFQPLMPEGVRFSAQFPLLPYQDEDGNWIQPSDDALICRVQSDRHFVDGLCVEADLSWTDDMFRERILAPMLSLLERAAQDMRAA